MSSLPDAGPAAHSLWSGTIRLLRSRPLDAATNMAMDDVMLRMAADTGDTLVRLYRWDRPSLSFGRNQRAIGIYSPERCAECDVPVVRRPTGGRALVHAREVTYSVAAPNAAAPTLRGGYDAINDLLVDALRRLGVPVTRATSATRGEAPGAAPCFESPATGELVTGSAKIAGSAQHRDARAFLQHGSILLDDDQSRLHDLALIPLPALPTPATLRAFRHDLTIDDVEDAIVETLRDVATGDIVGMPDSDLPQPHVAAAATHYRDSRWTWRR